jgi:hypothetical protein
VKHRLHQRLQIQPHHRLGHPVGHRGHAQHPHTPDPYGLEISTARTGGGKYVPDDSRFQILYRFPFRSCSNSEIDTSSTPGAPLLAATLR